MVWIVSESEFTYLPTLESVVLILIYDSGIDFECVKKNEMNHGYSVRNKHRAASPTV